MAKPALASAVDKILEKEMSSGATNAFDTHPALRDRVAALNRIPSGTVAAAPLHATSLLDGLDELEKKLLQSIRPGADISAARPIAWNRLGSERLSQWTAFVSAYAALLQGYTIERLPEAVARLKEIAPHIRDPKGVLLTREQPVERAAALLLHAVAVALVNHGWAIYSQPGEFYLTRGQDRIDPAAVMTGLRSGTLTAADWTARCAAAGIADLALSRGERLAKAAPTTPD